MTSQAKISGTQKSGEKSTANLQCQRLTECPRGCQDKQSRTTYPTRNQNRTLRITRLYLVLDQLLLLFSVHRSSIAGTSWCPLRTVTALHGDGKAEPRWDMISIQWTGHGVKHTSSVRLVLEVWALTQRLPAYLSVCHWPTGKSLCTVKLVRKVVMISVLCAHACILCVASLFCWTCTFRLSSLHLVLKFQVYY